MLTDHFYTIYIDYLISGLENKCYSKRRINRFLKLYGNYFDYILINNEIDEMSLKKNINYEDLPQDIIEFDRSDFPEEIFGNISVSDFHNIMKKESEILKENKHLIQKNKALEDIIVNLILVNNEYKRQIEGL